MAQEKTVKLGVIGLGHWGPNHVRVFSQCPGAEVRVCADLSEDRRRHLSKFYPAMRMTADAGEVIRATDLDAVVIATPAMTHFAVAKAALLAGKHVLLEKPMCASLEEARELLALRQKAGTVLMHGHVFLYNRGIQYVKESISHGDFGKIQYLDATRTNLGPIRTDVNVIQDLAAHEFAIFDYLFGGLPNWISASGSRLLGTPYEDVAFLSIEYGDGVLAHVHVSWLHPQKIRSMTIVGDKRMVVWEDKDAEPVRIYDKGVAEEPFYDSFGEFHQLRLRDADIVIPKLSVGEPLRLQAESFLSLVRGGSQPAGQAEAGLRVMQCLEAANRSLRQKGQRVYLKEKQP